jgi:hypothetical protein
MQRPAYDHGPEQVREMQERRDEIEQRRRERL